MNILGISSLASNVSQSSNADAIQLAVMKKAMDINAQSALQLIQVASNVIPSNPPHLGNKIDTFA